MCSALKVSAMTLLFGLITGCTMDNLSSQLIGHYSGINPCNDCPGILVDLKLKEKSHYHATFKSMEQNISNQENGIWKIVNDEDAAGKRIQVLKLAPFKSSSNILYLLKNNTTLQLLDSLKLPIESSTLKKNVP